jgi:hypothetical protein
VQVVYIVYIYCFLSDAMDKEIHKVCNKLFNLIRKSTASKVKFFLSPVNVQQYKDYAQIVKKPMDLGTVKKKLNSAHVSKCEYSTFDDFCEDMRLIFTNCMLYNAKQKDQSDSIYAWAADFLRNFNAGVEKNQVIVDTQLSKMTRYTFPEFPICEQLWSKFNSKAYVLFAEPVPLADYKDFIRRPICLATIKEKMQTGAYKSFEEFDEDMVRIGTNCLHFNYDPDKLQSYRDNAVDFLDKYDKFKAQQKGKLKHVLKSRMLGCRRALDLFLFRNYSSPETNVEKMSLPWVLSYIPDNPNAPDKPVCIGDVSDKLYSRRYSNCDEFVADLLHVLSASKPPYLAWSKRPATVVKDNVQDLTAFLSDLKGIISLPHGADGRPILPHDLSEKWPTEWYHDLSNKSLLKVLDKLESVDKSADGITVTFKYPVDAKLAPGYDTVIKDRLDLTTIRCRITSGIWYYFSDQFLADIDLITQNCKDYNSRNKYYVGLAQQLKKEAKLAHDYVKNQEKKLKAEAVKLAERKAKAEKAAKKKESTTAIAARGSSTKLEVLGTNRPSFSLRQKAKVVTEATKPEISRPKRKRFEAPAPRKRTKVSEVPMISMDVGLPGTAETPDSAAVEPEAAPVSEPEQPSVPRAEVFSDVGTHQVLKAVKKKNRKKEKKLSPEEEQCKRLFNRLHKDVVAIDGIELSGHYHDVWKFNWSRPFLYHPLEQYPQESFKAMYLKRVQKPIALYFAMEEGNEAVYDKLRTGEYAKIVAANPSGPGVKELFVEDAVRCFENAKAANNGLDLTSEWIRIKANHFLMLLNHLSLESIFLRESKFDAERNRLRKEREEHLSGLSLTTTKTYVDRITEFSDKVLNKLKKKKYLAITHQHWNTTKEALANVPGYTDVIKRPMDLASVHDTLQKMGYETYGAVLSDIRLCFSNALDYWGDEQRGAAIDRDLVIKNATDSSAAFEEIWGYASCLIYEYVLREEIFKKMAKQEREEKAEEERLRKQKQEEKEEAERKRQEEKKNRDKEKYTAIMAQLKKRAKKDSESEESDSDSDEEDFWLRNVSEKKTKLETCVISNQLRENWSQANQNWITSGFKGDEIFESQINNLRGGAK